MIFFPEKLDRDYKFKFDQFYEEINVLSADSLRLNSLLFKSPNSNRLIFYLHGNGGSLRSWGDAAKIYMAIGYDVFMIDYRGYGKSEGKIEDQNQIFSDMQSAYNLMKIKYKEDSIVIIGYSIGSGIAAKLAADNNPKMLILQAPYYSFTDLMYYKYPFLPAFILKYKLETNKNILKCNMPVILYHGDQDEVIYYGSSLKLKDLFKSKDTLITLEGQAHNGITDNEIYKESIKDILH